MTQDEALWLGKVLESPKTNPVPLMKQLQVVPSLDRCLIWYEHWL